MRTFNRSLALCLLALLAVACAAQEQQSSPAQLENRVRDQIPEIPNLSVFDNLTFQLYGHTVVLAGQVTNPALKADAERTIREINGVTGVTNHIDVLPTSPSDDHIRQAVLGLMESDYLLAPFVKGTDPLVHIIVRNGTVNLMGRVDMEVERTSAYSWAKSVPGVESVTNQIQVVPQK